MDAGQPDDLHPLLGRAVRGPKLSTGEEGVVAEVHSGGATIICADGTAIRARVKKCRLTQNPPGRAGMRSAAGALISAALGLSLPPAASQELHRRALALAGLSPGGFRALAADCATLGRAEPLAALPLPEPERTWWTARAMWTAGQPAAAATRLLDLPAGRYPARIALWWQTVTAGLLPEALRSPVAMATREFPPAPPAVALAASLLLRTLGERTGVASDAALVDAVRALGGDQVASWLDGRAGDSSAARLLAALSGAIGVAELGTDPAFPDAVPMPVLDDLADLGRIPQAWLASKRVGGYLRARTAIDTLDDAQLASMGAHDERARRAIRTGRPFPADLPPEVADRYAPLRAARDGDEGALLALAAAAGMDTGELRAALADPAGLPAEQSLADPSVARHLLERSTADPLAWRGEQLDARQRGFAARLALRRARSLLYAWEWSGALEAARTCLLFARDEALRDEAHNLIAAAQWQLGNDVAASQALAVALDGEYTAALQVNYAVVASELEPRQAAAHLSKLVREAPDLPLRISAAMQAVRIWRSAEQWQRGDPLPADLAGALRSLVVEPLPYDTFQDLVRLLATHDHDWLATPDALAGSPHQSTLAARIWTANARGAEEFIQELVAALRDSPEQWVEQLRDQLLQDLVEQLRQPGGDQLWRYGILLLEHQFPVPLNLRVVVLALAVPEVCAGIDPRTAEPAEKFLTWLEEAAAAATTDADDQLLPLLADAVSVLAEAYVESRQHQYDQAYALYESIRSQVGSLPYGATIDLAALRRAVQPGIALCQESVALLDRVARVLGVAGADQPGTGAVTAVRRLMARYQQLQHLFTQISFIPYGGY